MSTQFAVDLVFKTKGQNGIQSFERTTKRLDQSAKRAQGSLDRAGKKATEFGVKAKRASRGVNSLATSVRGLLTAAALLGTAKFVIGKTAELETQIRSLKVLTGELETAKRIVGELQQFAAVTPFTSSELIESAKRLKAFGVDTEKLVATTQRLADVSGATGARLNEVATAYGQIQAKGRLQGEELLQLQERGIALQDELQKMYGLTGEEFSKALQKGQFSAEAVEVAIKRLTEAGGKYADGAISQSDTLAGKFSTLIDGIENIARTLGGVLSPALKAILNEAIAGINLINQMIGMAQRAQKFGLNQQGQKKILDQARREAEEIVNLRNIEDPFERNKVFQNVARQRESDLLNKYGYETGQLQVEVKPIIKETDIPELLNQNTKTGGGSSGGRKSASNQLARQAEESARQLKAAEDLVFASENRLKLLNQITPVEKLNAEAAVKRLEIERKYGELLEDSKSAEETIKLQLAQQNEFKTVGLELDQKTKELQESSLEGINNEIDRLKAVLAGKEDIYEQEKKYQELVKDGVNGAVAEAKIAELNQLKQQVEAYEEIESRVKSLSGTIAGELTSAFTSIIDGSKSAEEAMADALAGIGKAFIDMAMQVIQQQLQMIIYGMLMKALGISMPGAGGGGSPLGMFNSAPQGFNNIGPMTRLPMMGYANGGMPSVSQPSIVGERGPELFIPNSAGRVVSNEAMSNYMPGGSQSQQQEVNVRYSVTEINSMRFVTEDQFLAGMSQTRKAAANDGAKMGEARTMNSLRNNRTSRARVGMK